MAEENKEEKAKDEASQKPAEAPKAAEEKKEPSAIPQEQAAPAAAAQPQAPAVEASGTPAAAEKKEAAPVKKEKPTKCADCSKSIKKKRWYYRDGKFYCTKRCWSAAIKKSQAKPEEAKAAS